MLRVFSLVILPADSVPECERKIAVNLLITFIVPKNYYAMSGLLTADSNARASTWMINIRFPIISSPIYKMNEISISAETIPRSTNNSALINNCGSIMLLRIHRKDE